MARPGNLRRHLLAAVLAVGTLATAACAEPEATPSVRETSAPPVKQSPVAPAESLAKYGALRTELIAALEQEIPSISWTVEQPAALTKLDDGRCILALETMVSSADIVEPSNKFADVFSIGDPILAKHGFPAFAGTDAVPGGWVVTRSTDPAGATLSIESKHPAYLYLTAPVDSATCDSAELTKP